MVRLGEILLEADVLTKRQLSRALAMQEAGDNRKLGEILVGLGYITLDDLTDIIMSNPGSKLANESQYYKGCLLYTSPSPRDATLSRMPASG